MTERERERDREGDKEREEERRRERKRERKRRERDAFSIGSHAFFCSVLLALRQSPTPRSSIDSPKMPPRKRDMGHRNS